MTDKQNANPTTENESSAPNGNAAARVTDQEEVRKIIEQYIDKADLEISENTSFVRHPAWRDDDWKSEVNLTNDTAALLKIKDNPAEWQQLNHAAKDSIKEHVQEWPLARVFRSLDMPYAFKILKDAKAYIPTGEFSQLLRTAWESDDFEYSGSDDFTHDEILELLESCNMQEFMTTDEWRKFKDFKETNEPIKVYRGFSTIDIHYSKEGDAFVWASSLTDVICSNGKFSKRDEDDEIDKIYDIDMNYDTIEELVELVEEIRRRYERRPKGYEAYVKSEDVLAVVIMEGCTGYIVDPEKLRNVDIIPDFADYLKLERHRHYDSTDEFHHLRDELYCLWDGFLFWNKSINFPNFNFFGYPDLLDEYYGLSGEYSHLWNELGYLWTSCERDKLDDFRDKLYKLRVKICEFADRLSDEGQSVVRLSFSERERFDDYMAKLDEDLPF